VPSATPKDIVTKLSAELARIIASPEGIAGLEAVSLMPVGGTATSLAPLPFAVVVAASFGLGVLVPGEAREEWARRHPQGFGMLAALESVVRRWPIVRAHGEYVALEGSRSARAPDTL